MTQPLVLKLGGELLETPAQRSAIAARARAIATARPLVIVHGGGRAIDAELKRRGIQPRKVDGMRVTDAETLDAVISVLAGTANTELVATLVGAGVRAVGLTGVDAGFGRAVRSAAFQTASGATADLGLVGDPQEADAALVRLLIDRGYVPVVASLGIDKAGTILNVNADVIACRIAASLGGAELVIAGGTPGVLDAAARTIDRLDIEGIDAAIGNGTATAGMVAKLTACRTALAAGVSPIRLIDGRTLGPEGGIEEAPGTTLVAAGAPAARA